jgi:hypothetical protein
MARFPVCIFVEAKFEMLTKLHRVQVSHCGSVCHDLKSTLHRRLNPEGLFRSFVCTDACYPCSLLCLISLSEHESCCQGRSEAEIGACLQGSGFPPNRDTQH